MSEVKVNKISPRSGTDVTLGDSGDTFTIPSGATINNQGTAVNFGATGSASWVTTVKTTGFTAVAGEGYFVNTTGGAVSVNLPAGSAGAVVAFKDYANTFDTNAVTLVQNGSDKVGGSTVNPTLSTEGIAVTLVFIDSTQGWLVTDSGLQTEAPTAQYVTATGGTITNSGDYRIHTFTGPGAFCVSCAGNPSGSSTVDYLVVAGGGAGGSAAPFNSAAGGGAGGFRESPGTASGCYSVSPRGAAPAVALPVSVQSYTITVGAGGAGQPADTSKGGSGTVSTFSTITSAGGGGAGSSSGPVRPGSDGGSGGGGAGGDFNRPGGCGNTPPVSPAQGTNGGNSAPTPGSPPDQGAGGGGGATEAGTNGGVPGATSGRGGAGATTSINASPTAFAGGGGGGRAPVVGGGAGSPCGTGGAGGNPVVGPLSNSVAGTTNRGGGGGGAGGDPGGGTGVGANGGSGIVIIRYKYQN